MKMNHISEEKMMAFDEEALEARPYHKTSAQSFCPMRMVCEAVVDPLMVPTMYPQQLHMSPSLGTPLLTGFYLPMIGGNTLQIHYNLGRSQISLIGEKGKSLDINSFSSDHDLVI
jgi:hypothetical protein